MSPTLADLVSGHDPVQALEEQQRPGAGSKSFEKLQRLSQNVTVPEHPLPTSSARTEHQPRVPAARRGVVDEQPRRR
jgi:hypothetical protein